MPFRSWIEERTVNARRSLSDNYITVILKKECLLGSAFSVLFISNLGMAETLNFRGLAVSTCTLGVPTDGTLLLGSDLQNWTTTVPATITAINTAPATLSVTKPTSWATSPAGTPATSFTMSANLTGTNIATLSVSAGAASSTLSLLGSTLVSVFLSAHGSDTFKGGSYTAQATVTCAVN